jgi:hypothetical protein
MNEIFHLLLWVVGGVAAVALGLALGIGAMRGQRRSGGGAAAGALFSAFDVYGGKGPELVEEAKEETRRKKDGQSGDPPSP